MYAFSNVSRLSRFESSLGQEKSLGTHWLWTLLSEEKVSCSLGFSGCCICYSKLKFIHWSNDSKYILNLFHLEWECLTFFNWDFQYTIDFSIVYEYGCQGKIWRTSRFFYIPNIRNVLLGMLLLGSWDYYH